ncbi:sialate O-acetylesterase [Jannaschia aquimarina]|uniref:Sialate O-acetylesterase domain-containing protein n=1 Tax=Jannaschia aquimarina TaxID=935700 RepID=A0A0D1EHK3_9RHOB|nr:sialate O-acetylesterase [Jannaschia aquimarina]KIT16311.1 hypothetical protein jaqu_19070 [Jannaschia aquimarina]SNT26407.1 hypothetical protein SAMN05421775_10978 [Jannaschia aquimarina]
MRQVGGPVWAYDGSRWFVEQNDLSGLETLGINSGADPVNRLSVASPATLLNHDGNGHQLKLNKAGEAETATLLFQTGFSGRAEMGTAGTDAFSVKVSPDGATWHQAIEADGATGRVRFPQGVDGLASTEFGDSPLTTTAYVTARGGDLITNGTGYLGNSYNFPGLDFDASQTPGLPGAFVFRGYGAETVLSAEPIPVQTDQVYRLQAMLQQDTIAGDWASFAEGARHQHQIGLIAYDSDGLQIRPIHHMRFQGVGGDSLTTLAAPLSPGDTVIRVTDASNWNDVDTDPEARGAVIFAYRNAAGVRQGGYSRIVEADLFDLTGVDRAGGQITLKTPLPASMGNPDHPSGTWPAGTPIANSDRGLSRKNCVMNSVALAETGHWYKATGYIGGVDLSGTNAALNFPPGTAAVRLAIRPNYSNRSGGWNGYPDTGPTHAIRFAGLSMLPVPSATMRRETSKAMALKVPQSDHDTGSVTLAAATRTIAPVSDLSFDDLVGSDGPTPHFVTDIQLSNDTFLEGAAAGTTVGTLTATTSDGAPWTGGFALSGGGGRAALNGAQIVVGSTVAAAGSFGVTVSAGAYSEQFTLTVEENTASGAEPLLLMIAGQSNSRVAGNSSGTPQAKYTGPGVFDDVFVLVKGTDISDATFEPYDITSNADPDNTGFAWGCEAEFVYQMRQSGDTRPVYLVKHSRNGQNLFDQWHPDTTAGQFEGFEEKVARARTLTPGGFGEELIIWNQGEADANVGAGPMGTAAADYAANFSDWFAAVRARVSASARIIVQRIRPLGYDAGDGVTTEQGWLRAWDVREAQVAVPEADGNATTIDTDFDQGNFGSIHPTEPWTEGMGLRSWAAYQGTYDAIYGPIDDTVPDAISFTDQPDVPEATSIVSEAVEVAGIERRTPVTATGGEFRTLNRLNADSVVADWQSSGFVDKFQKLQLRQTSASAAATASSVGLSVGGVTTSWTVTTAAGATSYEAETDAFIQQVVANGGLTISGARAGALDAFFVAAKTSSWWPKTVRLYLRLADEVSSSLDLRDQITSLTNMNEGGVAPMPWSSAGWATGAGSRSALDLKINPVVDMPQTSCAFAAWFSTLQDNTAPSLIGDDTSIYLRARLSGAIRANLHSGSNNNLSDPAPVAGMRLVVRDGDTVGVYGPDGSLLQSAVQPSIAPTSPKLYFGNPNGGVGDGVGLGIGAFGGALSPAEATDLAQAVNALHAAFA